MLPKPTLLSWRSSTETSSSFSFLVNLDLHHDCEGNTTGKSCKPKGCPGMNHAGMEQNSSWDSPSPLAALPLFPLKLPPCQCGQVPGQACRWTLRYAVCTEPCHGCGWGEQKEGTTAFLGTDTITLLLCRMHSL